MYRACHQAPVRGETGRIAGSRQRREATFYQSWGRSANSLGAQHGLVRYANGFTKTRSGSPAVRFGLYRRRPGISKGPGGKPKTNDSPVQLILAALNKKEPLQGTINRRPENCAGFRDYRGVLLLNGRGISRIFLLIRVESGKFLHRNDSSFTTVKWRPDQCLHAAQADHHGKSGKNFTPAPRRSTPFAFKSQGQLTVSMNSRSTACG